MVGDIERCAVFDTTKIRRAAKGAFVAYTPVASDVTS